MRLTALLLLLTACAPSPAPPAEPDPPEPTAAPTPSPIVQLIVDGDLSLGRLQIRLVSPASGQEAARAAADLAIVEAKRVAALPDSSPELARAEREAYAVDRTADILELQGMTDFLVHMGGVHRARGSQDATAGRGWRVAIAGVDPEGEPIGTVALKDVALARVHATTVIGPGAATVHRLAKEAPASVPDGFAMRTEGEGQDAAFDRMLEGVRVAP
ncbi:MAG: FAD:protein FMN transferase [Proteobacteria bacterium]|nr:FAD:protein FMN transferase [Pseudomonadota bacterium]